MLYIIYALLLNSDQYFNNFVTEWNFDLTCVILEVCIMKTGHASAGKSWELSGRKDLRSQRGNYVSCATYTFPAFFSSCCLNLLNKFLSLPLILIFHQIFISFPPSSSPHPLLSNFLSYFSPAAFSRNTLQRLSSLEFRFWTRQNE